MARRARRQARVLTRISAATRGGEQAVGRAWGPAASALLSIGILSCAATSEEAMVTPDTSAPSVATIDPETLGAGPNLLLVTLDTLRVDHVGAYGATAVATPTLDRLAAEGVRFAQAASTVPITLPAHASIMTGQIPPRHGVRNNGTYRLDAGALTLAEILADEGYATGGFVASFVLDARFGIAQGFAEYTDFAVTGATLGTTPLAKLQRPAGAVVDDALDWLGDQQAPFFAWVHLYDPHTPYEAPEPFASRYADRPYAGEVAYTDAEVGRLLEGLEALGHADETLVVVAADHGEGLGDHDEEWHTYFIYDSTIHVPLILWAGDALPTGSVVTGDASIVDVLTTSLALLGIHDPGATTRDGVDLRHLIAAPDAPGRPAYAESLVPLLTFGWSDLRGWRAGGWKYIRAPRAELYDLREDPGETRNLEGAEPQRAAAMGAALDAVIADDDTTAAAGQQTVDADTLERLRSLGYLAGGATATGQGDTDPKDKIAAFQAFNDGIDEVVEMVLAQRWAAAERELRAVDEAVPNHFLVQFYRGKVALAQGRLEDAVERLENALELNAAYSLTYVELARAYAERGEDNPAVELLEEAMRAYPEVSSFPVQLGDLHLRRQRLSAALDAYRAALGLVPDEPRLLATMAAIHMQLGAPQQAVDLLETLVRVTPEDFRAWTNFGLVLGNLERLEDAERAFDNAIAVAPDEARLHYNLGLVRLRRGDREAARRAFQRALDLDPGFEPARAQLARLRG